MYSVWRKIRYLIWCECQTKHTMKIQSWSYIHPCPFREAVNDAFAGMVYICIYALMYNVYVLMYKHWCICIDVHIDAVFLWGVHTEKSFRNVFKSNRNQIVFTIFLDWFGTASGHSPFFVPNQSENGKYNLILVRLNTISKRFLCVRYQTRNTTAVREAGVSQHHFRGN